MLGGARYRQHNPEYSNQQKENPAITAGFSYGLPVLMSSEFRRHLARGEAVNTEC